VWLLRSPEGLFHGVDAREKAGEKATLDMFKNISSEDGGKTVAVPGELAGMRFVHHRYGKLPWADLLAPVITLCQQVRSFCFSLLCLFFLFV
jgi:gamma-glutamyltranspeptidase/glutathione hydrolase